jgi:hypothetical protein
MALRTATNPDTGDRVILIGDAWQPIEKSATNEAGAKAYLAGGKWHTDDTASEGMPKPRTAKEDADEAIKNAKTAKEVLDISVGNLQGNIDAAGRAALAKTISTGYNVTNYLGKGIEAISGLFPSGDTNRSSAITGNQEPANIGQQIGQVLQFGSKEIPRLAEKNLVNTDRERYPVATQMGGLASDLAVSMPIGGLLSKVLMKGASYVPALAPYITPVATSAASGGFKTGLGPTGPIKPITGLPSYTTRDVAAEAATRAAGGGLTAGASTALTNPEDTGTSVLVGAALPAVAAPFVKAGVTGVGRVLDLVSGRAGDIKAARIAKTALGDQLIPATLALQQARPGITAVQALQEAGIDAAPFMSLGVLAEQSSIGEAYRRLAAAQTQEQKNMLIAMAGGRTQTEVAESLRTGKNALNDVTTPMRETALDASNQANKTISQLSPLIAQKEASMVSALQNQGQAATNAAQQTNLSRGGVLPATMGTPNYPNQFPSPIGGTGVPQPMAVATQAGLPRISPSVTLNAERAGESTALAGEMGALKVQRQAERDFLQNQIGSLEAHGLKPLNINPILNTIDSKLADPNLYGQTQLLNVLRGLRDDFTGAVSANGGVADARALYSMRKAGISQKIDEMYGSLDPSAKQKLTADVLASVKAPIDKAITDAGGTGWNRYLQTFETGMHELGQQKLAALALERFSGNKEGFLKLVRGNDTDAIEKVFGYGSNNIFKEMGRKSGQLESIASQLERDIAVKEAADSATQGLARIMGMAESKVTGVPAFFSKTATAVNMAAKILRGQVNEKTFAAFEKGMISGKSAAEMLGELPMSERNKVFRILKNSSEWNPGVANVSVQSSVDRTNNLAPENRNNLRP